MITMAVMILNEHNENRHGYDRDDCGVVASEVVCELSVHDHEVDEKRDRRETRPLPFSRAASGMVWTRSPTLITAGEKSSTEGGRASKAVKI